ncbi:MAG: hypothetical protein Ct9H300mP15_30240 [Gemmatimonadota bacterium]|nr:MAG: hypothetical protein Ct9H300mP15_30240 [Gemmatimonadota bacterium]
MLYVDGRSARAPRSGAHFTGSGDEVTAGLSENLRSEPTLERMESMQLRIDPKGTGREGYPSRGRSGRNSLEGGRIETSSLCPGCPA